MHDPSHEERLAAHLKAGVAALRAGRPDQALLHLEPVVHDPVLASTTELADVRARACCLLAQALLDSMTTAPQPSDFERPEALVEEAISLDATAAEGAKTLRERLLDRRQAAMERVAREARTKRLAATDIAPLLAKISDPGRRLDLMLQKAQAEVDGGRPQAAIQLAEQVLHSDVNGRELRHIVMAHLTLARCAPSTAGPHIQEALAMADSAGEFNLVGTIGRTAELLGMPLPTQNGPAIASTSPSTPTKPA